MKTRRRSKPSDSLLTGKKLRDKLDEAIRVLYKLKYPNPYCFVCKRRMGWFHPKDNPKGCQIGHYISRKYFPLRWDLLNLWPQCAGCNWEHSNRFYGSNPTPFSIAIIKELGVERLEYLQEKKNSPSPSTLEKRELLQSLQKQILLLEPTALS